MSSVYAIEPATKGKVVIQTTDGDIEIELWPKEAPLATRNFIQLCIDGYYNGIKFHRVEKDFIAQAGDPTFTGTGGESIYSIDKSSKHVKEVPHSRLAFRHRGILAMPIVSHLPAPSYTSQFFITLGNKELNINRAQNIIFGKVVGDTIYNVLKMNDCVTDHNHTPLFPTEIKSVDVIDNPFDDIIPRPLTIYPSRKDAVIAGEVKKTPVKRKLTTTKNTSLLSFGDVNEEEGESNIVISLRPRSLLPKKMKLTHSTDDDRQSTLTNKQPAPDDRTPNNNNNNNNSKHKPPRSADNDNNEEISKSKLNSSSRDGGDDDDYDDVIQRSEFDLAMKRNILHSKHSSSKEIKEWGKRKGNDDDNDDRPVVVDDRRSGDDDEVEKRRERKKEKKEKRMVKKGNKLLEEERLKYLKNRTTKKERADKVLEKLSKFQTSLRKNEDKYFADD